LEYSGLEFLGVLLARIGPNGKEIRGGRKKTGWRMERKGLMINSAEKEETAESPIEPGRRNAGRFKLANKKESLVRIGKREPRLGRGQ